MRSKRIFNQTSLVSVNHWHGMIGTDCKIKSGEKKSCKTRKFYSKWTWKPPAMLWRHLMRRQMGGKKSPDSNNNTNTTTCGGASTSTRKKLKWLSWHHLLTQAEKPQSQREMKMLVFILSKWCHWTIVSCGGRPALRHRHTLSYKTATVNTGPLNLACTLVTSTALYLAGPGVICKRHLSVTNITRHFHPYSKRMLIKTGQRSTRIHAPW